MFIEIIKQGVSAKGKDIPLGEIVETDESSAVSLIADGYAKEVVKAVAENALKTPVSPYDPADEKVPTQDTATQGDAENGATGGQNDGTEAELDKVRKALNDRYNKGDLYKEAKAAGVEIAYDARKPEIIDALIATGKAAALLTR